MKNIRPASHISEAKLPEGQEEALNVVISQCEMWTDNGDGE